MNKVLLSLATLALLAGCAGTKASGPSELDGLRQEVARMRTENGALKAKMAVLERGHPAGRRLAPTMPPPAKPRPLGPPQHWAWMHTPPQGCSSGILSLEIENFTGYYLKLFLDGEELTVRGAQGVLPHLPPRETVYVCLSGTGHHTFRGIAFQNRYGVLQEVKRFSFDRKFTRLWGARGRHKVLIDRYKIR
ncbi:hypothetical protein AMJ57_05305 [Parcubacteria bacterium SG8_24]|nr:MAG: hypothetical protein AMJ57_05305 [Parcubacteria bacterium SG8_24]